MIMPKRIKLPLKLQNKMKYTAFIFDLDGTLLNTLEDLKSAVNYALGEMSYPKRTLQEVKSFIGNGIAMLVKRSLPQGVSAEDEEKALELFKKYYALHLNDNTAPYDGIEALLKYLKSMGIKTGVVTNKNHLEAKRLTEKFFGDLIDVTVGHKNSIPTKPNPQALFEAMKELDCDKSNTLFFGDSDVDVLTAHNAGVPCVGVTWGFRDREVLESAGADFIIQSPEEAKKLL